MNNLEEWFLRAPWGDIALASWGDPRGEPVLLVHGRQDSMSTFKPLLELLPSRFYYVALDLPGHGKSDAFPIGVMITRLLPVSAIHFVIRHLKWNNFVYIGHSMGAELGLFYNAIYPGNMSKLVLLDVKPGLQRLQVHDPQEYFRSFYVEYYSNYRRYNVDDRTYTEEEALRAVMKARGLTRDQASAILARNLVHIGHDKYRLSWDKRQKLPAPLNLSPQVYVDIFSRDLPPTLLVSADQVNGNFYDKGKEAAEWVCGQLRGVRGVEVVGGHDVHFTHPQRLRREICAFLDGHHSKSKL